MRRVCRSSRFERAVHECTFAPLTPSNKQKGPAEVYLGGPLFCAIRAKTAYMWSIITFQSAGEPHECLI
jgi:hypothetical protein